MGKVSFKERLENKEYAVEGDVLIVSATVKSARNGEYADLELSDGTMTMKAKKWQTSQVPAVGTVIRILGEMTFFNDKPQITIKRWFEGDTEPEEFAVHASDEVALSNYDLLLEAAGQIGAEDYKQATMVILETFKEKWLKNPAAIKMHHNYQGGLAQHTLEVLSHAVVMAQSVMNTANIPVDLDLIKAGAILHDAGKLQGYSMNGVVPDMTNDGKFVEHIIIGCCMLQSVSEMVPMDQTRFNKLQHMIASHHGELEWGSPVKPCMIEALIVSMADNLSAKTVMMKDAIDNEYRDWTDKNYIFGASLYTK